MSGPRTPANEVLDAVLCRLSPVEEAELRLASARPTLAYYDEHGETWASAEFVVLLPGDRLLPLGRRSVVYMEAAARQLRWGWGTYSGPPPAQ